MYEFIPYSQKFTTPSYWVNLEYGILFPFLLLIPLCSFPYQSLLHFGHTPSYVLIFCPLLEVNSSACFLAFHHPEVFHESPLAQRSIPAFSTPTESPWLVSTVLGAFSCAAGSASADTSTCDIFSAWSLLHEGSDSLAHP